MFHPLAECQGRRGSRVRSAGQRFAAAAVILAALSGCSDGGDGAQQAVTTKPAAAPTAGVESFCDELADIVVQDEPDFGRLDASAPVQVKPQGVGVVQVSKMARTAEEAPDKSVIDDFQRSYFGMTIYAVGHCDNSDTLAAGLGLGDQQLEAARRYSLEDVRDDQTWPEVKAAVGG